jgi:hypothetical protein
VIRGQFKIEPCLISGKMVVLDLNTGKRVNYYPVPNAYMIDDFCLSEDGSVIYGNSLLTVASQFTRGRFLEQYCHGLGS